MAACEEEKMYNGNTPATDLRNAAFVVEMPRNWTRGTTFEPSSGRMCAGGAIHAATNMKIVTIRSSNQAKVGSSGVRFDPQAVLTEASTLEARLLSATNALQRSLPDWNIAGWNDSVVTGPEEVAAQMRLAADQWESEHPELAQSVRQADLELAGGPAE